MAGAGLSGPYGSFSVKDLSTLITVEELQKEKEDCVGAIKYWEQEKADYLARLSLWFPINPDGWKRKELEGMVQLCESYVQHYQQHLRVCQARLKDKGVERSQRVLQAKSLINIIAVIFNYMGLPRSGKTSFRRRITGEIENILKARQQGEVDQPSTGVMEDGGQVFIRPSCLEMGAIRSKVWCVLKNLGDEVNMLNQLFQQVEVPEGINSVPPFQAEAKVKPPNKKLPFWKQLFKLKKDRMSVQKSETTDDVASTADEMFSVIREAMATDHWEEVKYLLEDTILLSNNDTGGHAEFLDLQAALVQGPSINLLFSRLVDDLDSLFKIYYTDKEGRSTDKEDSTMTVEEVLYQSLASIACFSGAFSTEGKTQLVDDKKSESKAMFVGTHLDMVSEEEFKEKDQYLRKKIESTEFYKKGIVEYASEDQLMLAVDNMKGGQAEIAGIQRILEKVIEASCVKISIPAAWLVLSLYLRKKKFRTISLKECENLAEKLGINPEELQDALWFLHHRVGVLLYYPEVEAMKDIVICQMQVVFDSTSNLIRNTFTFNRVGHYASKEFKEKGQFSLKDVKKAASGHTDSLIPLEKLVMLLQHLSILTPILPTPSSGGSSLTLEPTYFMPCVLHSARASELQVTMSSEDPPPLMLRYECGYVPVGVFPSMITNLVSQQLDGWKLIQKHIYKNRVGFCVGDDYDTVTFISHPRFIEIAITRTKNFVTSTASLCAHVRGVIHSTLATVTSRMNYHFKMGYKFGFECPIHPGREHLCVLAKENATRMECLLNPEDISTIRLEPHHKIWFTKADHLYPAKLPFSSNDYPTHTSASPAASPATTGISSSCADYPSLSSYSIADVDLLSSNAALHTEEISPSMKLLNLLKWKDEQGVEHTFQLGSRVSTKWRNFGLLLCFQPNELDGLDSCYRGVCSSCWNKVMEHWLDGRGEPDYPPTWEGLYTLLKDTEHPNVAKELSKAVAALYSSTTF